MKFEITFSIWRAKETSKGSRQPQICEWFNRQGNLPTRLMLTATRWIILSICPPESWVYTEAFMSFTHVHCPDGLNNPLMSKGCSHQMAPTAETVGRRWNTVSLVLVMVSLWVIQWTYPLYDQLYHLQWSSYRPNWGSLFLYYLWLLLGLLFSFSFLQFQVTDAAKTWKSRPGAVLFSAATY